MKKKHSPSPPSTPPPSKPLKQTQKTPPPSSSSLPHRNKGVFGLGRRFVRRRKSGFVRIRENV